MFRTAAATTLLALSSCAARGPGAGYGWGYGYPIITVTPIGGARYSVAAASSCSIGASVFMTNAFCTMTSASTTTIGSTGHPVRKPSTVPCLVLGDQACSTAIPVTSPVLADCMEEASAGFTIPAGMRESAVAAAELTADASDAERVDF